VNQGGAQAYGTRLNVDNVADMASGQSAADDASKAVPFKICMIGSSMVGKTCIVERYVNNNFSMSTAPTISAAFHTKIVEVQPQGCPPTKVKLQIWDTAGEEKFRAISNLYY